MKFYMLSDSLLGYMPFFVILKDAHVLEGFLKFYFFIICFLNLKKSK